MDKEKTVSDSVNLDDYIEANKDFLDQKISFDSNDFEALVDAFRTLLQWSKDLEDATQVR